MKVSYVPSVSLVSTAVKLTEMKIAVNHCYQVQRDSLMIDIRLSILSPYSGVLEL